MQNRKEYNIMAVATTIPRYNKNQMIIVENHEMRLIDHLKELRISRKITKKKISNLVKQNDYWYSQIERSGKNGDDNRQLTIYKTDLIKIIAIVKFGATTYKEIIECTPQSTNYIDKIIKAIPVKGSAKKLELYQLSQGRTTEEQENLLEALLEAQRQLLHSAFEQLSGRGDRDVFLDCLKNINSSLKIDPMFIVYLAGMPFTEFLYETKQEDIYCLLRDLLKQLDKFEIEIDKGNTASIGDYLTALHEIITEYTGKTFMDISKKNYIPLSPDEWQF